MDTDLRNAIERATQRARQILEEDFAEQLEGEYDVMRSGRVGEKPGAHLDGGRKTQRKRIVAAVEHKRLSGMTPSDAVKDYLRDAAFTTLNRFVALKMLEARDLVQECITRGDSSAGFAEFCGLAPGAKFPDGSGYRLYIESIFDELSTEVKILFDRRDPASALWPRRAAFEELLKILNTDELKPAWGEDETIGWVYQYFNSGDERRQMREESQAPRNSRELAVRNQFFTPRYVVQFLTDNTLGRIWYEMRKGKTSLANLCEYMVRCPGETFADEDEAVPSDAIPEGLTQDELWRRPIRVPRRAKKDPRDIQILDPACGSGHFLLYCFILLLAIYEEAWADETWPASEVTGRSLRHDFPNIEDLRLALPGLILRHNLHGVDIDPRCAQIAQLALWMRTQRAYRDFGVGRADRPVIRRANIVIAEPMPGEKELLTEFLRWLREDRLEDLIRRSLGISPDQPVTTSKVMADSLADLVKSVWHGMKQADQLGPLLRIEHDLSRAIDKGREEWESRLPLFQNSEYRLHGDDRSARAASGAQQQFWEKAEMLVRQALADYASAAQGSGDARRRLFADDTAQGLALVDVLAKRFDVLLMNPPFGQGVPATSDYLKQNYVGGSADILCAFLSRSVQLCDSGRIAAITSRTPYFLPTYGDWRKALLCDGSSIASIADLGNGVLDKALVETFCVVLDAKKGNPTFPAFRLTRSSNDQKPELLRAMCSSADRLEGAFTVELEDLKKIDGFPIVYSSSKALGSLYSSGQKLGEEFAWVEQGLSTKDDFRYLRLSWEIYPERIDPNDWAWIAKGGEYSPFCDDLYLTVNARRQFRELDADICAKYPYLKGNSGWVLHPDSHYLRGGITYPERTTSSFGPRILPASAFFSHVGLGIIPKQVDTYGLLGALMSRPVQFQVELLAGSADAYESGSAARHYSIALISNIRLPNMLNFDAMSTLAHRCVSECGVRFCFDETSTAYSGPLLAMRGVSIEAAFEERFERQEEAAIETLERFSELSRQIEPTFGIDQEDLDDEVGVDVTRLPLRELSVELTRLMNMPIEDLKELARETTGSAHRSISKKTYIAERRLELISRILEAHPRSVVNARRQFAVIPSDTVTAFCIDLISYLVGIAFGRFSNMPTERSEHVRDALAAPMASPPIGNYSDRSLIREILVDDAASASDLFGAVEAAYSKLGISEPDAGWEHVWAHAGVSDEPRQWLAREYFRHHLSTYSRARRRAPIYWQLAVPSATYSVWLYVHALNKDTFFRVQNDYVQPKLASEQRQIDSMQLEFGESPNSAQRKAMETQQAFVEELQSFYDEVKRVAPLWNPNLDDGVIINCAPLWRLTPQNRAWQRELRSTWDALVNGDYDWSHLAMHLWPERVVPKCVTDRSLAVAHGLEDIFWFEDEDKKWKSRENCSLSVEEIVRERTSPAVKEALRSLMEAPDAAGTSKRGRRRAA